MYVSKTKYVQAPLPICTSLKNLVSIRQCMAILDGVKDGLSEVTEFKVQNTTIFYEIGSIFINHAVI